MSSNFFSKYIVLILVIGESDVYLFGMRQFVYLIKIFVFTKSQNKPRFLGCFLSILVLKKCLLIISKNVLNKVSAEQHFPKKLKKKNKRLLPGTYC